MPAQVVIEVSEGTDPQTDPPQRRELRDLLYDPTLKFQRDLFLLSLQALMAQPASDPRSYYQIAGIHGEPYVPYDGVGKEQAKGSQSGGYCWHGSQLFPTWHRPYMMLIEQELRGKANALIKEWEGKDKDKSHQEPIKRFIEAQKQLRFPYFDWANKDTLQFGLPDELCYTAELSVKTPFREETIPNPLLSFVMPNDVGDVVTTSHTFNPMSRPKYKVPSKGLYTPKGYATVRYPDSSYESQPYNLLRETLKSVTLTFIPSLARAFAVGTWKEFSNHTCPTEPQRAPESPREPLGRDHDMVSVSLEGVHDQVHNTVGGKGGHMSYTEFAAFDPIFWLHHCNVDRLLALWQSVYDNPAKPETWIQKLVENTDGTWTSPSGKITTSEDTHLTPFRKKDKGGQNSTTFWTSKDVRSLEGLGYTYPEIVAWKKSGVDRAQRLTEINKMYDASVDYKGYRLHVDFTGIVKRQMGGPFHINVFVGCEESYELTADTPTRNNAHFAGTLAIFANGSSKCKNCEDPERQLQNGSVDLTAALLRVGVKSAPKRWSPGDLKGDEKAWENLPFWTHPPTAHGKDWKAISKEVLDDIRLVCVKADGSEAHHVIMDSKSVSWSRPIKLSSDLQIRIAESKAITGKDDTEYLPAPVAERVRDIQALPAKQPITAELEPVLFVALPLTSSQQLASSIH